MKWKIRLQQTPRVLDTPERCCFARPWSSSSVWQLLDAKLEQVKEHIAGLQEYSEDGGFKAFLSRKMRVHSVFSSYQHFLDARS